MVMMLLRWGAGRLGRFRRSRAAGMASARAAGHRRRWPGRAVIPLLACAGCGPGKPAPPPLSFAGFPVTGSIGFARRAGFRDCFNTDAVSLRCRRHAVTFLGEGPYEAALDLRGGYGEEGFDQLTLWSEADNDAVYRIIIGLAKRGWHYCYTGNEQWSDQAIFSRRGEPVRMMMDISYWGRRRLRVVPAWSRTGIDKPCTPDPSLIRFGSDVARAAQGD